MEPGSPALQADSLLAELPGKPYRWLYFNKKSKLVRHDASLKFQRKPTDRTQFMEIVSGMVLPWLFKHAWKFIDINTPKGVGTPSVARLLRRQGWSAWAAVLPCHCGMWTWSPSDSKQLLQDRQWHSKAQTDGLRFWVASPLGTAFRAVFISHNLIWQFWHQLHQTCKAVFAPDSAAVYSCWMSPWAKPDDFSRENLKELSHSIRSPEKETPTPKVYLIMSSTVIHFSPTHFHTSSLY